MARVIEPPSPSIETARYRHSCGALVEFTRNDVQPDSRDGSYVVCPACETPPWIAARFLTWDKPLTCRCPRCGSLDITDASQSLDCNNCGKSW